MQLDSKIINLHSSFWMLLNHCTFLQNWNMQELGGWKFLLTAQYWHLWRHNLPSDDTPCLAWPPDKLFVLTTGIRLGLAFYFTQSHCSFLFLFQNDTISYEQALISVKLSLVRLLAAARLRLPISLLSACFDLCSG